MSQKQREAHLRLMQSLPVTTHRRDEPVETNKYTGKPLPSEAHARAIARRVMPSRVNTWLDKNPD